MSRRTLRVLGLTLVIAVFGSAFVANADARKLSKAQKHAISKKLMRAVKHNPKVVSKRWFLKQASLVSFSLPTTIRLDQAAGQNGQKGEGDFPRSRAILDLGPSLGTRTIPLSGVLHANINFNDAFDGGHLGDVRITLPPDPTAALSTTSVALLSNPNTTNAATQASANEINRIIVVPAPAVTAFTVNIDPGAPDGGVGSSSVNIPSSPEITACIGVFPTPNLPACDAAATQIDSALEAAPGIGAGNLYTVAANAGIATGTPALGTALLVQTVGVGALNQTKIGGYTSTGGLAYPAGPPTLVVPAQKATYDAQDMGGCGNFKGNGAADILGGAGDIDSPLRLKGKNGSLAASPDTVSPGANTPGDDEAMGDGYVSPDPTATPGDVVLRTGALKLNIAAPTSSALVPGDNEDNPGSTLKNPHTGAGTSLDVADAAPFTAGQAITVTDGFQSNTATVNSSDASTNPNTITVTWTGTPPTATTTYAAESAIFVNSTGVVQKSIGTSGGRGNLFGQPINGLAKGNSVDVTVNLGTDIHSIAREVDGNRPKPIGGNSVTTFTTAGSTATVLNVASSTGFAIGDSLAVGGSTASPPASLGTQRTVVTSVGVGTLGVSPALGFVPGANQLVSHTPEVNGNISAYFNCRTAWTGSVRNYLTGIKLVGALRVSPAVTADGKVRIAKVNLRTPAPVPESLAACLTPYQLYMKGNPLASDFGLFGKDIAPGLFLGAGFNPLIVLSGSSRGNVPGGPATSSVKPDAKCNANGGPLNREPFNVTPQASGATDLNSIITSGAAVGVSGTLSTIIKADVVIGTHTS